MLGCRGEVGCFRLGRLGGAVGWIFEGASGCLMLGVFELVFGIDLTGRAAEVGGELDGRGFPRRGVWLL